MTTLQIGLIASADQTSGSDRYYFNLVRALRDDGVGIDGIVLGDPATADDAIPEVASFSPKDVSAPARWAALRRAVATRAKSNDIVVSHLAPHVFPVLDIIRDRPLVEHFHGPWALEGAFGRLPARTVLFRTVQERLVYARAKRIIVLSRSFGEVLERRYRVDPAKIRLVPGGADLARFGTARTKAAAREEFGLPSDRPIVGTVRRLESTKGVDRLIAAMVAVRETVPDVLLVIAGTGTLREAFEREVRERDLERNVVFAGFVDDHRLALLYRAADITIVPSVAWEGFGLVCIESLASGTPVLVTPVGGLPEAVDGLERALVLEGSERNDIAAGLRAALSGELPLPSEAACVAYASAFGWQQIARRVHAVYREVA